MPARSTLQRSQSADGAIKAVAPKAVAPKTALDLALEVIESVVAAADAAAAPIYANASATATSVFKTQNYSFDGIKAAVKEAVDEAITTTASAAALVFVSHSTEAAAVHYLFITKSIALRNSAEAKMMIKAALEDKSNMIKAVKISSSEDILDAVAATADASIAAALAARTRAHAAESVFIAASAAATPSIRSAAFKSLNAHICARDGIARAQDLITRIRASTRAIAYLYPLESQAFL